MFTANKFALQNITYQRFRSLILFFLVWIVSTCIFGTGIFTESMKSGIAQTKRTIVADIIVVPSEFGDEAREILFEGNACTILFQKNPTEALQAVEGVKQVSQQLYLATLQLDCCASAGVQLIAIDIHSDFAVGERLKNKGIETLHADEIIAGSSTGLKVNDQINFYGRNFTVAAILEETGIGYDESVFLSFEAADQIVTDPQYEFLFHQQTGLSSMVLVNVADGYSTEAVKQAISYDLYDYGISAYSVDQLTERLLKQFHYFQYFGFMMNLFVLLLAAVSLFSLITITFYQRRNRVGSLLSVGIERKTIIQVFLLEYIFLMLLGIIAGILLTILFLFPLHHVIKQALDLPYKFIGLDKLVLLIFKTVALNSGILFFAASLSFYKILKLEPAILAEEQT